MIGWNWRDLIAKTILHNFYTLHILAADLITIRNQASNIHSSRTQHNQSLSSGRGGGGRGLVAGADVGADLAGVQVVVDEAVDDVGEVGLHQGVAQQLQLVRDGAQGAAQLREETIHVSRSVNHSLNTNTIYSTSPGANK